MNWESIQWTSVGPIWTRYFSSLLHNHSSSLFPSYQPLDISPFWNDCMHRLWKMESSTPINFLNELTTFLSYASNSRKREGGGELQNPCAPSTSNREFCTPEVPLKSVSNSFGKVDAKILLAGEIELIIHARLLVERIGIITYSRSSLALLSLRSQYLQ